MASEDKKSEAPEEAEVSLRPTGMTGMLAGMPVSLRPGGGLAPGLVSTRPKKEVSIPRSKKLNCDPVKYEKAFLLSFKETCTVLPAELEKSTSEAVLNNVAPETEGAADPSWSKEEKPADSSAAPRQNYEKDNRDWRSRTELPAPREQSGSGREGGRRDAGKNDRQQGGRQPSAPMPDGPLPKIDKAASPFVVGAKQSDEEQLVRSVKGILNKLTPEKFDKLSDQLVELGIATADQLRGVISLVFDKAVAEPGFCALYARLCMKISKEGESKPMTFRRVLLNTCQEEFEGAANQRAGILAEIAAEPHLGEEEKEFRMRKVKLRTLGNIRLIGELYKEKMIMEKILHACVTDLLGSVKTKELPPEENIEALCNLLTTVGKTLDCSARSKPLLEGYFSRLAALAATPGVPSRIRFMCRDVVDLRKNKWKPRREKLEAKTIEEVHAEAAKEMGVQRPGGAKAPVAKPGDDERALFPEGPSGPMVDPDGWEVAGRKKKQAEAHAVGGQYSALTGAYVAKPIVRQPVEPTPAQRPEEPKVDAAPAVEPEAEKAPAKFSDEALEKKMTNLIEEFLAINDKKEVDLALKEWEEKVSDKSTVAVKFAKKGVTTIVDKGVEKEGALLIDLLCSLGKSGVIQWDSLKEPVLEYMEQMDDLAMDVPMAPKLLGQLCAAIIIESSGKVTLAYAQECCEKMEDMFTRRDVAGPIFTHLKAKGPFMKLMMDSKIDVKTFLTDEDAPDAADDLVKWLEGKGLGSMLS
eukprot:gene12415-14668_t